MEIIGGADGPTAIFIALPNSLHIGVAIFTISLIIGALFIFFKRR